MKATCMSPQVTSHSVVKAFRLRSGQGSSLSPLLLSTVLEVLAEAPHRQEKEMKGIQFRKGRSELCLFVDDMVLYAENREDVTQKLLELIKKFSKVRRWQRTSWLG